MAARTASTCTSAAGSASIPTVRRPRHRPRRCRRWRRHDCRRLPGPRPRPRAHAGPPGPAELCALVTGAVDDLGGVAPFPSARPRPCAPASANPPTTPRPSPAPPPSSAGSPSCRTAASATSASPAFTTTSRTRPPGSAATPASPESSAASARPPTCSPPARSSPPRARRPSSAILLLGTALATLPQGRLLDLAAQASRNAACSSRLELYRRDLPADLGPILHAAPISTGELRLDEVEQRVGAATPTVEPLPPRPAALDALLAPLGLHGGLATATAAAATRPAARSTPAPAPPRGARPPRGASRRARTPQASRSRAFEARLAASVRDREPLLLAVTPFYADLAAVELSRVLKRPAVALDRLLLAALDDLARAYEIDPAAPPRDGPRRPARPGVAEPLLRRRRGGRARRRRSCSPPARRCC